MSSEPTPTRTPPSPAPMLSETEIVKAARGWIAAEARLINLSAQAIEQDHEIKRHVPVPADTKQVDQKRGWLKTAAVGIKALALGGNCIGTLLFLNSGTAGLPIGEVVAIVAGSAATATAIWLKGESAIDRRLETVAAQRSAILIDNDRKHQEFSAYLVSVSERSTQIFEDRKTARVDVNEAAERFNERLIQRPETETVDTITIAVLGEGGTFFQIAQQLVKAADHELKLGRIAQRTTININSFDTPSL